MYQICLETKERYTIAGYVLVGGRGLRTNFGCRIYIPSLGHSVWGLGTFITEWELLHLTKRLGYWNLHWTTGAVIVEPHSLQTMAGNLTALQENNSFFQTVMVQIFASIVQIFLLHGKFLQASVLYNGWSWKQSKLPALKIFCEKEKCQYLALSLSDIWVKPKKYH